MNAQNKRKIEGATRWMVTFADLMALLFALFVLLLSFAEVDSDSFRKNAGPMRDAFGMGDKVMRTTSLPSIQQGESGPGQAPSQIQAPTSLTVEIVQFDRRMKAKRNFLWQFRRTLERELASSCIVLIDQGNRIIIRFPDATAFVAGGAEFASGVEPTLKRIASILRATKGQILVSGHTDNSPISTARFRSNWDLSSARAVSVVHFLITRAAVSPSRITAQGFADSRPLVKNDTPENQSRNRRVEISIEITSFQG